MRNREPELLLLELSGEVAGHLCLAVQQHKQWARRAGLALPDEIDALEQAFAKRARRGQAGTPVADLPEVAHARSMPPAQLLDYRSVAQVLGVGERTVKRLVSRRALSPVRIGGSVRIRVADVDAYLQQLGAETLTKDE